jgi:serine/threonine-protein kinase
LISPYEELVEIDSGKYVERFNWEEGEFDGEPLPEQARLICRYLRGSFVIFSTRSIYNLVPDTYDGRHDTMSEQEFRTYIESNAS